MTPRPLPALRRASLIAAAVILVQLAVFALVWSDTRHPEIHDVPVAVAAPPIVADGLVTDANRLDGSPFDARIAVTAGEAKREVANGVVVAALFVDLVETNDTLYVASAQGEVLATAVADKVKALERGYDREVKVVDLVPAPTADKDLRITRLLVFVWMVIGFAAVTGIALAKGTRPESRQVYTTRLLGLVGLGVAAGLLGALATMGIYDGSWLGLTAVGALTTFTAGAATMALQSMFGLPGIGIATVVFLMLAGPDVIATHVLLLPQPWSAIDSWVPHGASTSAVVSIAYFNGHTVIKPVLVLCAWAVLSVAATILSRREIALAETRG